MDFNSFDDYLREEISQIENSCYVVVNALRDKKMDKETAFAIINNLKTSAVNTFNKRCDIFDSAHLDYTGIENAKHSFLDELDSAVYNITNDEIKDIDTRVNDLLR